MIPSIRNLTFRMLCATVVIATLAAAIAWSAPARALAADFTSSSTTIIPLAERGWEDEIMYVIDLRTFFNGDTGNDVMLRRYGPDLGGYNDGYPGGDIAGVIQHLGYLSDLGVTTLLLSPIVQNDQYPFGVWLASGYRPKNYFAVDENLGTTETLVSLVSAAHARGMRVLIDMPISLPGVENPLYTQENVDKGYFGDWTGYGVRSWNLTNPFVANYMVEVSKYWRDLTHCDGFRIDSVQLNPNTCWTDYAAGVGDRPTSTSLILMGEVVYSPSEIGQFLTDTGFTTAYDFSFLTTQQVFGTGTGVGNLAFVNQQAAQYYPQPSWMCSEIDNYGDAFIDHALDPKDARSRVALGYLLTMNRVPMLYSGNEVGIRYGDVGALFPAVAQNADFLAYVKKLIALRTREEALRRGSFAQVHSRNPVYAFVRTAGQDRVLVATNNSTGTVQISFSIQGKAWSTYEMTDLLQGRLVKPAGSSAPLPLPGPGIAILRIGPASVPDGAWLSY